MMTDSATNDKPGATSAQAAPFGCIGGEENKVNLIVELGDALLNSYVFKSLRDTEEVLIYRDGVYEDGAESLIKEKATSMAGQDFSSGLPPGVLKYITYKTFTNRTQFNTNLDIINVENGLLNIKTGELKPHTPDFLSTVRIPVKYDPNADCPEIKQFLSDIVPEGERALLEEIPGYCLYKKYFIKKMVMLLGGGDNGKTVYLNLVTSLLGASNVSNVGLNELETNRFASSALYGRLANIQADLSTITLKTTGRLKSLSGGDQIQAELKFKNTFSFSNYATLLFATNTMPETHDSTEAFFERWIIIDFPYQFKDTGGTKKADKNIIEKLTTENELSGFLNLALQGLKRLLKNEQFTYAKTAEEIEEQYRRVSNTIYGFLADCCEMPVDGWTTKEGLYNAYIAYCKLKKLTSYTINKFGRELPKFATVTEMFPTIEGEQKKAWRGIVLKNNSSKNSE